jgi:hypothetical protein
MLTPHNLAVMAERQAEQDRRLAAIENTFASIIDKLLLWQALRSN